MCVSPTYVYLPKGPKYVRTETACGWCWSCQKNRVNDLVGRCLLEADEAQWTCSVTLTYDDNRCSPVQTKLIHKKDVQDFMKRLRKKYKVRYLVAGEYGKKKGRCHFHVCLFGHCPEPPPSFLQAGMVTDYDVWPFGHMFVDPNVSERSVRYIAKYLLKGAKRKKTRFDNRYNKEWVSYSRIPIMGEAFIRDLARRYARERIFPRSFKYRPPGAHPKREYQLTGEGRFVLLDEFFAQWPAAAHGLIPEPMQAVVLAYTKDRARKAWDALPARQREKILTDQYRTRIAYVGWAVLAGRFLQERMEQEGFSDVEAFAERFPEDAWAVERAFGRYHLHKPPHAEGRNN